MATLVITGSRELMAGLPARREVRVSIVPATATDHGDGTWSVNVHASEDQIAGLTALGYGVRPLISDAEQQARWAAVQIFEPPVA
jgi:hypothetical protein